MGSQRVATPRHPPALASQHSANAGVARSVAIDIAHVATDELLELLERSGATLGLTRRRELIVLRPAPWWEAARTDEIELRLRWAIIGRDIDTEWRRCTRCKREAMRPRRAAGVKCPLTFRCHGRLERRRPRAATDDGATPCARPGCTYAAVVNDHHGRPLCRLDLIVASIDHQGAQSA